MANTAEILQGISRGTEARLYADQFAIQIAKNGLNIFAVLCAVAVVLMMFNLLAAPKKSIASIIMVIIAGVSSWLLFDKASAYEVIDDHIPVIAITPTTLEYDVRRVGWTVPWAAMDHVETFTETTQAKQSTPETTQEVRVYIRQGMEDQVRWKYDPAPENEIAQAKKRLETTRYLVVQNRPLGVDAKLLGESLERCRQ